MQLEETRPQTCIQGTGPFVFLHIPKTAGMSLIRALHALKDWAHTLTGPPFLSPDLLLRARGLAPSVRRETLVYGHPLAGTYPAMQDATLMTVVREPASHAVSHYLFTQRRPEIPLHGESLKMDFTEFVRKNWQYLVYQSISLGVSDSLECDATKADFQRSVPRIYDMLRRIDIVGTTDDLTGFVAKIARILGVAGPGIERLNQATEEGISTSQIAELRAAYRRLAHDHELGELIAYEQALYGVAKQRAAIGF